MGALKTIWVELTRPRTLKIPGRKAPLTRRSGRRSGIALLVAVTTLLVLSVVVSELAYISQVRFQVAYHQRDKAQAYWLARSGVNIYQLVLVGDKQIGRQIESFAGGLGVASLWQMVPVINTGLMRMLFVGDASSVDDLDEDEVQQLGENGKVSDEIAEASREGGGSLFSDRNFLDFEGDFSAEVTDNESRIDVNILANVGEGQLIQSQPAAQFLFGLMSNDEDMAWLRERNMEPWELIGNLKDWVDADNIRSAGLGGYEDSLYNSQEPPYLTKNAPFDTIDEIRLVEGWQDEVFDKYGKYLTVFSGGKLNPNNWDETMHAAAIAMADPSWLNQPPDNIITSLGCFSDPLNNPMFQSYTNKRNYVQTINNLCQTQMEVQNFPLEITSRSQVFTITSTGLVGNSAVKITAVLSMQRNVGQILYWRVE
ncbi:MAG: hypothetical protein AAFV53_18020 [Myxococcota bacterium]